MIYGFGIGTVNKNGKIIESFFPNPGISGQSDEAVGSELVDQLKLTEGTTHIPTKDELDRIIVKTAQNVNLNSVFWEIDKLKQFNWTLPNKQLFFFLKRNDSPPESVEEAYLKLHLLSHRKVKPHQINLDGVFKVLVNIAWTNYGPIDLQEVEEFRLNRAIEGTHFEVNCVDKFPKMTDYVIPSEVRIADTARVRLGAYIGKGTTVMHEGFVNFNAGTEGPNMVEGRISAGVMVREGSDLGGGCSTMGTLSGGGNVIISVGKHCLIGANGGIGIPLGDNCVIESGLYVTSGTVVTILDNEKKVAGKVKARELSNKDNLLFRRNSTNGVIECLTSKNTVELNSDLHLFNA